MTAVFNDSWILVIFREFVTCFQQISEDKDCRAVVISGSGKVFTAGKRKFLYLLQIKTNKINSKIVIEIFLFKQCNNRKCSLVYLCIFVKK